MTSHSRPAPRDSALSRPTAHEGSTAVITALVALVVLLQTLIPRFATVILFAVLLAAVLVAAAVRARRGTLDLSWSALSAGRPFLLPVLLFAGWSGLACLWSADKVGGLGKDLLLVGLIVMSLGVARAVQAADAAAVRPVALGFLIGMLLAAVYLMVETSMQHVLARWLFDTFPFLRGDEQKHVRVLKDGQIFISEANLNRSTTVFCFLLTPALLAASVLLRPPARTAALALLAVAMAVILFFSTHQSSQLAVAIAAGTLGIASLSLVWARRILIAIWIGATALAVPAALAAFKSDLYMAPWVFQTARARVIIWNYVAERVLEHPIIGAGTNATEHLEDATAPWAPLPKDVVFNPKTATHPHNVYLQIWYELGLVGAVLFAWAGLAFLAATRRLDERFQPFALAAAGMTIGMIAPSYGFWQTWFQTAFALGLVALAIVMRAAGPARHEEAPAVAAQERT